MYNAFSRTDYSFVENIGTKKKEQPKIIFPVAHLREYPNDKSSNLVTIYTTKTRFYHTGSHGTIVFEWNNSMISSECASYYQG